MTNNYKNEIYFPVAKEIYEVVDQKTGETRKAISNYILIEITAKKIAQMTPKELQGVLINGYDVRGFRDILKTKNQQIILDSYFKKIEQIQADIEIDNQDNGDEQSETDKYPWLVYRKDISDRKNRYYLINRFKEEKEVNSDELTSMLENGCTVIGTRKSSTGNGWQVQPDIITTSGEDIVKKTAAMKTFPSMAELEEQLERDKERGVWRDE